MQTKLSLYMVTIESSHRGLFAMIPEPAIF